MTRYTCRLVVATFLTLALLVPGNWLPRSAALAAAPEAITLDFKDIELSDFIQTISELTGKNFVYDQNVRGKATIISSQPMSREEAYQLFLTVMNIKGYTVVPSGKTNKIVEIKDARVNSLPTTTHASSSDQFVTRMLTLEHIDAADVASAIISPLMAQTGNIVVYEPSNKLIITDNAANIQRFATILRELDQPGEQNEMQVIALEYADAIETAKICNDLLESSSPTATRAIRDRKVTTSPTTKQSKIIAYERANKLIAAVSRTELSLITNLVRELDQKPNQEHSRINLYRLKNADAVILSESLNTMLSGVKPATDKITPAVAKNAFSDAITISPDKPTNSLIVNATPEDYRSIEDIIRKLDIQRRQVYVEALIMELSMQATEDLGIGLQGGFEVGSDGIIGGSINMDGAVDASMLSQSVKGILAGGFGKLISFTDTNGNTVSIPAFSALLKLSKTDSNVNILSAPRLLTSDNEEAEIVVGSNVPIITSRLTDSGSSSLAQSVSVERKDVALTLRITPQITDGNQLRLNIYQETTAIDNTNTVGDVDQVGPTFTTRKLTSTVLARNGQSIVLGGLISNDKQRKEFKVPFLGDIPLLGFLFKTTSFEDKKTNLLIFITPTIIESAQELNAITENNRIEFDQLRLELGQKSNTTELK
ncbi:MAG: type II secretion system secretin GspD [Desulfuromonas sp.]|nr:type II secretion system secretin GspD [Desulfuromonas sp.]